MIERAYSLICLFLSTIFIVWSALPITTANTRRLAGVANQRATRARQHGFIVPIVRRSGRRR